MRTIDMHCDTLMLAYFRDHDKPADADIFETPGSIDLDRLHRSGAMAQFFAAFLPSKKMFERWGVPQISDDDYISFCKQILDNSVAKHSDIAALACTAEDIRKNYAAGKTSAVFTLEDGRAVDGKLENLKRFYDMGVRAISLTWNFENCFGYPNSTDPAIMNKGLTDFGKEAVAYMQQLGMLVDVSHLSDGGFYDVAKVCTKPFVATHSNARVVSPHPRNLTDDMLRTLGDAGGVAGINFCPQFLSADLTCKDSRAADMAANARHMADVGGMDCVAIGTDFDGFFGNLEVSDPTKMDILAQALKAQSFSDDQIDKIFSGNVLRVMDEAVL